jgi:crotonobetainyl-CoA:carnitine CoA-transferase CaiB-like acyl-CoA transferase
VRNLEELFSDPQVLAREMVASIPHDTIGTLRQLGIPLKLSETPGTLRAAPPRLGQHTDAVLAGDAGLAPDAIARLRREGVI